ncbi:AAA family ATPase [Streptomyces canus]|uniref:AAA family ATPase n=1 Tax=Streptomyces canus TaxID=58343 RepID=UPI003716FCA7
MPVYLACLYAENFRIFGAAPQKDGDKDASLSLDFGPATNVLVGENDSGKTAIIDAIRLCLLTTAADFYRITRDDFHVGPGGRTGTFKITCGFKDLTTEEQAVFLELLTTDEEGNVALYVTVKAELMDPLRPHRVAMTTRTGRDGQGPALDGAARELLKATYLRPLRDAEAELRSGRGSRLSQILAGYPAMRAQGEDDFDEESGSASTLVGILRRAERHISDNEASRRLGTTSTPVTCRSSPSAPTSCAVRSAARVMPRSPARWSSPCSLARGSGPDTVWVTTTPSSWRPNCSCSATASSRPCR